MDLNRLPVVSINGVAPMAPTQSPASVQIYNTPSYSPSASNTMVDGRQSDIFTSIEKLATRQSRGILSEQEFASK